MPPLRDDLTRFYVVSDLADVGASCWCFEDRDAVYQQIWKLPSFDGLSVQVSTFSAGGSYGGSCTRADRSAVIRMDSDCLPLRILPDDSM